MLIWITLDKHHTVVADWPFFCNSRVQKWAITISEQINAIASKYSGAALLQKVNINKKNIFLVVISYDGCFWMLYLVDTHLWKLFAHITIKIIPEKQNAKTALSVCLETQRCWAHH